MLALVLLIATYAIVWRLLLGLVGARPDPDDRPVPWPRGVQEGEPVRYAVEALTPRCPPEPVEAVTISAVRAHVTVVGR